MSSGWLDPFGARALEWPGREERHDGHHGLAREEDHRRGEHGEAQAQHHGHPVESHRDEMPRERHRQHEDDAGDEQTNAWVAKSPTHALREGYRTASAVPRRWRRWTPSVRPTVRTVRLSRAERSPP